LSEGGSQSTGALTGLGLLGALAGIDSGADGSEQSPNLGESLIEAIPLVGPILEATGVTANIGGSGITRARQRAAASIIQNNPVLRGILETRNATGVTGLELASLLRRESPGAGAIIRRTIEDLVNTPLGLNIFSQIFGGGLGQTSQEAAQAILNRVEPETFGAPGELERTADLPTDSDPGGVFARDPATTTPGQPQPAPRTPPLTNAQRVALILQALQRSGLLGQLLQQIFGRRRQRAAGPGTSTSTTVVRVPLPSPPPPSTPTTTGGPSTMPFIDTGLAGLLQIGGDIAADIVSAFNPSGPSGVPLAPVASGFVNPMNIDIPGFDVAPQGAAGLSAPFRNTASGARAVEHIRFNPRTGKPTTFVPAGRCILRTSDISAKKRVEKVAKMAKSGRRRPR